MTDNRYGSEPLGKSVEEVEGESGNRVNSSVPGETQRDLEMDAAIIPAVVSGGTGGSAGFPAVIDPNGLVEDGSGPQEDRRDPARQPMQDWGDQGGGDAPMPDQDRGTSES